MRSARGKDRRAQELWALDDVSFEVAEGEVIGIIGRNGAGKSTLLKLLSRLTEPTRGRITVEGKVGSLLEIGTGFHPELTGRDNIYLNGTILGMSRADVSRRFDEIVEFAEIDRFLDTPVKRYSSGMYVRLAFAVAAHLESEILIVDEVLAVGDVAFQRKCLGRMGQVANEGRTVLFVSHNLAAIKSLCTRALLLQDGKLVADGPVEDTVTRYLDLTWPLSSDGTVAESAARIGTGDAFLRQVRITDDSGKHIERVFLGQPFRVTCLYEVRKRLTSRACTRSPPSSTWRCCPIRSTWSTSRCTCCRASRSIGSSEPSSSPRSTSPNAARTPTPGTRCGATSGRRLAGLPPRRSGNEEVGPLRRHQLLQLVLPGARAPQARLEGKRADVSRRHVRGLRPRLGHRDPV
ncbi:MAG: ABC transporter ATP-binding protein [Chloroflexi bacterium]|nr:MAG: ABC transporter ATP-binding protein [Chloroflexota bacterium]